MDASFSYAAAPQRETPLGLEDEDVVLAFRTPFGWGLVGTRTWLDNHSYSIILYQRLIGIQMLSTLNR
jgi:hypothetical protein